MEPVDLFWSFRSHYCYLGLDRILDLTKTFPLRVTLRPVLPVAIRDPEFFANIPKAGPDRWAYVVHDTERTAQRLGIAFGWPDPDPVVMDMRSFDIAAEQPHIFRLSRLGVEASRRGAGLAFAEAISRLIFGGNTGWDKHDVLEPALQSIGLELDDMQACIEATPEFYDAELAANEQMLHAAGHWGVPTLVIRGEPFFGQDRIEDFAWRLSQLGISKN
jgi:2-hydroxychromene-2-carboxylate isomerase